MINELLQIIRVSLEVSPAGGKENFTNVRLANDYMNVASIFQTRRK